MEKMNILSVYVEVVNNGFVECTPGNSRPRLFWTAESCYSHKLCDMQCDTMTLSYGHTVK